MFGGNTDTKPVVMRIGFSNGDRYTVRDSNIADAAQTTKRLTYANGSLTSGGAATTNIGINDTIETEIPYYNGTRFSPSRIPSNTFGNGAHSAQIDTIIYNPNETTPEVLDVAAVIRSWKSVGEDFTFFFFTGCPIVYRNEIAIPA